MFHIGFRLLQETQRCCYKLTNVVVEGIPYWLMLCKTEVQTATLIAIAR